jgi:serine phosphatase RsbU (regulator of sigma subunit)
MKPFTQQEIRLKKGDMIYMFTDGYADQFGGEKGKKYMVPKLRVLFISVALQPMDEQFALIEAEFENWKKGREQVDDVCMIGIKI